MARVLGRIRLSRSTDESTSVDRQRQVIENYAQMHNHQIVGFAIDEDVSGSLNPFETPELGPWLTDRLSEWDILVSWKLDRLGRGLYDLNDLFKYCHNMNKSVACTADPVDTSNTVGRMVANLLASVAEMELEAIRTRTKAGRAELLKQGRYPGGKPPYGYVAVRRVDSDGNPIGGYTLELDPVNSAVVRRICEAVCTRSIRSVCASLDADGIPAPKGGKWTVQTVIAIVRSRWVLGIVETNGEAVLDHDGNVVRREPIVSTVLHARANAALDKGMRPTSVKNETALMIDAAKCVCGAHFHSHVGFTRRKNKNGEQKEWPYAYYRCSAQCGRKAIKTELLDAWSETILGEIGDVRRTERVQVIGADEERIADLSIRITDMSRKMAELDDEDDEMAELISRLKRERKALKNAEPRWETVDLGETYAEAWDRMDKAERRALLAETGITFMAELEGKNGLKVAIATDEKTLAEKFPGFVPFADRPKEDYRQYETRGAKSA